MLMFCDCVIVDGLLCNGEAQDSKSVDMESLPEQKGMQKNARDKILQVLFFMPFLMDWGRSSSFNRAYTGPGIMLWHFPGLESPGKRLLVLESSRWKSV